MLQKCKIYIRYNKQITYLTEYNLSLKILAIYQNIKSHPQITHHQTNIITYIKFVQNIITLQSQPHCRDMLFIVLLTIAMLVVFVEEKGRGGEQTQQQYIFIYIRSAMLARSKHQQPRIYIYLLWGRAFSNIFSYI